MQFGYFLNKEFGHFQIISTKRMPRTIEKEFNLTTLVENEFIKGKLSTVSKVSKLLDAQESLTKKIEELRIILAAKNTKIIQLNLHNQMLYSEGPGFI